MSEQEHKEQPLNILPVLVVTVASALLLVIIYTGLRLG